MTIRDIGILFGYKVDQSSEQKVEGQHQVAEVDGL